MFEKEKECLTAIYLRMFDKSYLHR